MSAWPALDMAQTYARLTAPGAPFEMRTETVRGRAVRTYVHAPQSLAEVLHASRRFEDRDLLVFEGERVSFEGHWRAAVTLANELRDRFEVATGDRVAVAMRNYPEWSVAAWATLAAGGVLVPLNAWEPGPALVRILADSGAKVLIADAERLERIAPFRNELGGLTTIGVRGAAADVALEALISQVSAYASLDAPTSPEVEIHPDDDATIFYTSGTTGQSKGAVGSHRNVATNLVNVGFRAARAALRRGQDIPTPTGARRAQLLPLPFFHVTGFQSSLVPAVAGGTTLVLMHKWDAERAIDLIEQEAINALTLVPSQAIQLVQTPGLGERDLSSVDAVGYGGAAAPAWLAARVRELFPRAWAGQGYGATETSSLLCANSAEDMLARPGSVGTPCPASDLRIVREDGQDASDGEPGEIWAFGPNVVRGYWNALEASAEAFVDGWYRTGDIGSRDAEGFVTLLDRAKDMLIRGGENIYCPEIEEALGRHPAVLEAAVIGVPDAVLGEVVRPAPGARLSPQALVAEAAASLAVFKRPVVILFQTDPLPRNAAGKVLKRDLKPALIADGEDLRRPETAS